MVADLPVGENLQDHVMVDAIVATVRDPISIVPQRSGMLQELLYKVFGTGRKGGWEDGWMDVRMYVCMYVCIYIGVCRCIGR